jgi:hypothetical protein
MNEVLRSPVTTNQSARHNIQEALEVRIFRADVPKCQKQTTFCDLTLQEAFCQNITDHCIVVCKHKVKGKGKAIPLQAWTGPEGSRRLRLPDFKKIDK